MESADRAARVIRTAVEEVKPGFAVRLWNGERMGPAARQVKAKLRRLPKLPLLRDLVPLVFSRGKN